MSMVILLSATDSVHVSGPSAIDPSIAALTPFPLTDGRFYLGVEVLDDPSHAEFHDYLAALSQADYASLASLLPPDAKAS
jgi:hypothetical protein